MAQLDLYLPREVEIGAVRHLKYSTEIVVTDGGSEVRNARWSEPLRTFELSFPTAVRDDPVYTAVIQLFNDSLGGLHSFWFRDWTDETGATIVPVRFDTPLSISGVDIRHDHIDTLTLVEVR